MFSHVQCQQDSMEVAGDQTAEVSHAVVMGDLGKPMLMEWWEEKPSQCIARGHDERDRGSYKDPSYQNICYKRGPEE